MRNNFGNRSRKTVGVHVTEKYFGQSLGNTQDPDDANDSTAPQNTTDGGNKIGGKGSISGGSKPTPQASPKGSAHIPSSYPRSPQRIRG